MWVFKIGTRSTESALIPPSPTCSLELIVVVLEKWDYGPRKYRGFGGAVSPQDRKIYISVLKLSVLETPSQRRKYSTSQLCILIVTLQGAVEACHL